MRQIAAAVISAVSIILCSLPAMAGSIWVADSERLYRVDTTSDQITISIKVDKVRQLITTGDGAVWALAKKTLSKFSAAGALVVDFELERYSLKGADFLSLVPSDNTLWIAEGKGDDENDDDEGDGRSKRIIHLDNAGQRSFDFVSPGRVRAMVLGLDQTLWLLGNKRLWHYSFAGAQLAVIDLKPYEKVRPRLLAVDAIGVWLWLAGEKQLLRLDGTAPAASPVKIDLSEEAIDLKLDTGAEMLWLVTDKSLLAYGAGGALKKALDLKALGISDPAVLAFEPTDRALWLAHNRGLTSFSRDGVKLATIPFKDNIEAIGVTAFILAPTVDLLEPANGLVTRNATPAFRLNYGAVCSGNPCAFSNGYFSSYGLNATLGGQPVGASFQFDVATGTASFTPSPRLSDGINSFSAQVKDSFGNFSNIVTSQITIDTTAPKVMTISPVDGTVVNTPNINLVGSLDEVSSILLTGAGLSQSAQGTNFSFPAMLVPGPNTFTLKATDAVGNESTTPINITLAAGLQVTISSPQNGASVPGSTVTVTGTFQGPPSTGISVNGTVAAIFGNQFVAVVDLIRDENQITVTATTEDATISQTLMVIADTPTPPAVELGIYPNVGIAPHKVTVTIPSIPDRDSARTQIDFNGDGVIDATAYSLNTTVTYTYQTPGIYFARTTLDDYAGGTYTQTFPIVVRDVKALDRMLQGIFNGMLGKLKAGNIEGALKSFTPSAVEQYRPVFEDLRANLATVVEQFGTIVTGSIAEEFAEYVLVRNKGTVKQAYLIYFFRGGDGVWRISQM